MSKGCRQLHTVNLFSCDGVDDAAIISMFTYCSKLTALILGSCEQICGKCLEDDGAAAIKRFDLRGCDKVSDRLNTRSVHSFKRFIFLV